MHFYNVVLMGYYGYSNLGDDLLFLTTLHIISKHSHIKNVFVPAPKRLERLEKFFPKKLNVEIINRYSPLSVSRAISKSHATIFGGGNLFQDETSNRSFIYYYFTAKRTLSLVRPLILLSQGFGPVENPRNLQRLKKIVNSPLTYGLLRDINSFHYASENSDNFTLSVDYGPLFLMSKLDNIKQTRDAKLATIVLKDGIRVDEIIKILKAKGIEKIFVIGFQNHREKALIESSALQARKSGLEILRTSDNWKDIITNISNSRIVITERLHGGLLSLYFGVPFIWLKGKKLDEVLSSTIENYDLSYSSETGNLSEIINEAI
ncbi:MAG: polysaccharide pyruvyl transferase family protein, partial [Thermotogota bacterium]|nr:polysaccharide pyruvyl transferase family protein [Thermotogota bacterium]